MIFNLKVSKSFDLDKTLDCGQCFRWYKKSDSWIGIVLGHMVKAKIKNNLFYAGIIEISIASKIFNYSLRNI